ncbi:MAG: MqnA/MqnD/SBP family protein [Deltaproteobacteria bacterium]|nr:MqnA/MqnD/SBP family protein [Deltaproteobacteria bacterium]
MVKLGTVPYLNALPLVSGIDCEIYTAPPALLARQAAENDIILAPIVTAFLDPSWHLLEGVGIGSFGAVETVRLFLNDTNVTIQNLNTIYTDLESLTSVALLKILLSLPYNRDLTSIHFTGDKKETAQGSLLIGDKVWEQDPSLKSLDLGECWTKWTGLPFLFACWMTKNPALGKEWKPKLVANLKKNSGDLESLVQKFPAEKQKRLLKYWRQLVYDVGPAQKNAVALFQKYWTEMEQKPQRELNWI